MKGRLLIVGTGLQLGHLTIEAKSAITSAKKLLYLVPDIVTENYLIKLNKNSESLKGHYKEGKERKNIYEEMIEYIMNQLIEQKDLCVAFYGHPGVFTYPSHKIIQLAKEMDFTAKMLPGISTEDMIFAELGIDPGTYGLQTFEATYFLRQTINFDPRCYVILWQIGVIGQKDFSQNPNITNELSQLQKLLLKSYPIEQEIILYQSSSHRMFESEITKTQLQNLTEITISPISTMIIEPLK